MEIDNEVPDPPSMENISEENGAFEPISVAVDEIAFDHCMLHESVCIFFTTFFSFTR